MPNNISDKTTIEVAGKKLKLANLNKVFYPLTGFTKGQMLDYYIRIAPVLLPHLANRPLTFKRYPNGVTGKFFYQKDCPVHRPEWVKTIPVWSEGNRKYINYCNAADLSTLIWAANLAVLELHTSLSLAPEIASPSLLVFDLDPGPPATIVDCAQVALWLKEMLAKQDLKSFPKTSGAKGLQVYVPLNTPLSYDHTKSYARLLANRLQEQYPQKVVANMKKKLRSGKVFIDWSQNDEHKTTVCVYSLRAGELATVSTPVTWEEVEAAWHENNPNSLVFEAQQVLDRVKSRGDLFGPLLGLKQNLPATNQLGKS
ncbi:MAG TPA: non-homologous end-joining DNA ligase [Methylomusa anaerophila]|uniref:Putative DNA ligase-like protein/MT0965 n=1 Tax=Methylomusa anaerophila TaxID=1930071 RepID=A0A348ANG1_9FIRM|nr:non-homologous end-joining DNA ligase [Methylomusa anaerophila]BBB92609.1 putative DNA ligase-like protein/MT0965 [Methylomusa anaerophila]HML87537.1 non-homologous end-joining DNA ligase [Methylomusa anaerophila]